MPNPQVDNLRALLGERASDSEIAYTLGLIERELMGRTERLLTNAADDSARAYGRLIDVFEGVGDLDENLALSDRHLKAYIEFKRDMRSIAARLDRHVLGPDHPAGS